MCDSAFGGGSDPVSGYGTLTAIAAPGIPGADEITGGSGTVTDSAGTYQVTILSVFQGGGTYGLCSSFGEAWAPATANCGTLHEPPLSNGANFTYGDLIYPNALPGSSVLDANGIVLYNAAGPPANEFFEVWSAANSGNPLPDNFQWADMDPYAGGNNVNLANPFTVTPEPGFYGALALGLSGLVTLVRRRKRA